MEDRTSKQDDIIDHEVAEFQRRNLEALEDAEQGLVVQVPTAATDEGISPREESLEERNKRLLCYTRADTDESLGEKQKQLWGRDVGTDERLSREPDPVNSPDLNSPDEQDPSTLAEVGVGAPTDVHEGVPMTQLLPARGNATSRRSDTFVGAFAIDGPNSVYALAPANYSDMVDTISEEGPPELLVRDQDQTQGEGRGNEETLIEAILVQEEEPQDLQSPSGAEQDLIVEAKPLGVHLELNHRFIFMMFVAALLVVAGIVTGVVVNQKNSDSPEGEVQPDLETAPVLNVTLSASSTDTPVPVRISTLERIRKEGVLRCGILDDTFGSFMFQKPGAENTVDAEMCRAIAAAAMGRDSYQVEYITVPTGERGEFLNAGTVDVLIAAHSITMARMVDKDLRFASPHAFALIPFLGDPHYVACAENGLRHILECADLRLCVITGNRQHDLLNLRIPQRQIIPRKTQLDQVESFINGDCNVVVTSSNLFFQGHLQASNYTGNFTTSDGYFTIEPLSMAMRSDDPEWKDFVEWVKQSWFVTERFGITKENVERLEEGPRLARPDAFGNDYKDMLYNAIGETGTYGEIWHNYFNMQIFPRGDIDYPVNATDHGIMHSKPFGKIDEGGLEIDPSGTAMSVVTRGALRCGIKTGALGFATKDQDDETGALTFSGIDVDFCRAVASGVLGSPDGVEFVEISSPEEGFVLLHEESVDVVAGLSWNFLNDVKEPTTGVGFSFTDPYFFNNTSAMMVGRNLDSNRCLVTRQTDHEFEALVFWILQAIVFAEENGITREDSTKMPIVNLYGSQFRRLFRDAVGAVGGYGEIYERNLESHIPRQGLNKLLDPSQNSPLVLTIPGILE